jgi:hypothetical protein
VGRGGEAQWELAKRRYERLADKVETVAPYLAERALANRKNNASIAWISPVKMLARLAFGGSRDVFTGMPSPRSS